MTSEKKPEDFLQVPPPPEGTYPPPEGLETASGGWQPPAFPPVVNEPPRKTRRVGTLTLGICLVALGVVLVLRLFLPNLDYVFIARLAPLALVLLGAEILWAAIRHKDAKLRYDWVSMVLCILLLLTSVTAIIVPDIISYERTYSLLSSRFSRELDAVTYEALDAAGIEAHSVDYSVYYNWSWPIGFSGLKIDADTRLEDLPAEVNVNLWIELAEDFDSKAAFAARCEEILGIAGSLAPHLNYVSIGSQSTNYSYMSDADQYQLSLSDAYRPGITAKSLENYIERMVYMAPGDYMYEAEYYQRLHDGTLDEWYGDYGVDPYDDLYDDDPEDVDGAGETAAIDKAGSAVSKAEDATSTALGAAAGEESGSPEAESTADSSKDE